jgi:hypothetical protein
VQEIHNAIRICVQALQGDNLSQFSVNERMSSAGNRNTKREEDLAYSLPGIFNVHMLRLHGRDGERR